MPLGSCSPCSWTLRSAWPRSGETAGAAHVPTLQQGCTACGRWEGRCTQLLGTHPWRQITPCDTGVITARLLQRREPILPRGEIVSDCTWAGEEQPPFPLAWHQGRVRSSLTVCNASTASAAAPAELRVQLQRGFSSKLLVGVPSAPKGNNPRPARSCEGHAGTGAWEVRGTIATLLCCGAFRRWVSYEALHAIAVPSALCTARTAKST